MDEPSPKTLKNWALFRFSVVGGLLARPPEKGELQQEITRLAERIWRHPITNEPVPNISWVSFSTVERWYYRAIATTEPIQAMARKQRKDTGKTTALSSAQLMELAQQYKNFPHWSYQLHLDNLAALVKTRPDLGRRQTHGHVNPCGSAFAGFFKPGIHCLGRTGVQPQNPCRTGPIPAQQNGLHIGCEQTLL